MWSAIVFTPGELPNKSDRVRHPFATRLEAKAWARANHRYENDVYVLLHEGTVQECGMIDKMYEDDAEYQESVS